MLKPIRGLCCLFLLFNFSVLAGTTTPDELPPVESEQTKKLRIIVLAPHIVEMLYEIGAGDMVIATTEHSDYPEAAKQLPLIGNYARIQIEQVLSLAPDIIIGWRTGNPADDLKQIEKFGLNLVYSDPRLLTDIGKELRWLGELTGKQTQAEVAATEFETRLAKLKARYQNKRKISTFYELWSRPLTTIAKQAWPQQSLDVCGGENPFIDSQAEYPQIGLEQVVEAKPKVIIQPDSSTDPNPDLVNWRKWPLIPAAKHNQIYKVDANKIHRMTSRLLDELDVLCEKIDQARRYYWAVK